MRVALAILGCAGCQQVFGLEAPTRPADARLADTELADGHDAPVCYGAGAFAFCIPAPTRTLLFLATGEVFDTTAHMECATVPADWITAGQPDACFVLARTMTVSADFVVRGTRPLVLLGSDSVTIGATIDVASHRGVKSGPGAPSTSCAAGAQPQSGNTGSGGGAGGSFTTTGGSGGAGNGGARTAGISGAPSQPTRLRAGCTGQTGGNTELGNPGGNPGVGGGAIYIVAGTSITLQSGTINASGGGASASGRGGGGGGGGSGGMIVLYAPTFTVSGTSILVANGGGGSGGGGDMAGELSSPGGETDPASPLAPAVGGNGGAAMAGDGGDGFALGSTTANGGGGNAGFGGGGGGGGAGFIRANMPVLNATTSPNVTVL